MSVTNHERPGVYSRYDASTVVKGRGGGGGCVGLAALCGTGTAGTLYTFNRYEEAVTAFGGEETLTELVRLLFLNGAAQVKAVPVAEEAGYKAAFSVLEAAEDIAVVVCDSGELTVQQALRDSVKAASEARRERIAVVGGKAGENATALVQRAEGLNSERVVLTAPVGEGGGAAVAAAVAGAIAGESDPAIPLGGAELKGVDGLEARYGDTEIDTLVRGGVTPAEPGTQGQEHRAEPGSHPLPGGAGAGKQAGAGDHYRIRRGLRRGRCGQPHGVSGGFFLYRGPWAQPDLAERAYHCVRMGEEGT